MSRRYWNTTYERHHAVQLISFTEGLIENDDNVSSSSSSSSLSMSSVSSTSTISIDEIASSSSSSSSSGSSTSSSSISDESTSSSSMSISLVDVAIEHTITYLSSIYRPILDETIDFDSPPTLINDYNESTCISFFRFRKSDLLELSALLWPRISMHLNGEYERIVCENRYTIPFECGLLILLYRFSRPTRIRPDMERFFGMRKSKLSSIILTFARAIYEVANRYLNNPQIMSTRWEFLAKLVREKSNGAVHGVWGFIDGTLRKSCRPSRFQRLAYSGHKRCHGIKFQSVVTPDGLIAMMFGPIPGSRHDSFMLGQSNLVQQLREIIPLNAQGMPAYQLYGDPAYPQSGVLFGGFRNVRPGTNEARWNTEMSKVRESVEWLFKEITVQWSFLDFKPNMKIFKSPIGKYYIIGAFLTNLRCCCYGSQTSKYFDCDSSTNKLNMKGYFDLIPLDENNEEI